MQHVQRISEVDVAAARAMAGQWRLSPRRAMLVILLLSLLLWCIIAGLVATLTQ